MRITHKKHTPLKKKFFSVWISLGKWITVMAIWCVLFMSVIILWFGSELPDIESLAYLHRKPSVVILDSNEKMIASYNGFYAKPVNLKELPDHVVHALLAIEDRRFYHHWGIDPFGIVRAFLRNWKEGKVVQGGSTITQQLAKNFLQSKQLFSHRDRSLQRKICEAILAWRIENRFTKDQILTIHLNRVYMGAGVFGLEAAAQKYFDRPAKDLGVYESAVLMGLLQGPSLYSPTRHYERSETRAKQVLKAMVEAKFISQSEADMAMAMPAPLAEKSTKTIGRHFADWIMDQLYEMVETLQEDIEVVTTLQTPYQTMAERYAKEVMATYGPTWNAQQTALVSMTPGGAIQAMVGGLQYEKSSFNRASKALRQSGSAFKYIVYLLALEEGYTPSSLISDVPVTLGTWKPKNYKYTSKGLVSLRDAFAYSINTATLRLAMELGVPKIISMAKRLGITTPLPKNYTIALGTGGVSLLELTRAFGVMANKGYSVTPYGIQTIRNRKGVVYYRYIAPKEREELIDDETLAQMRELLRSVVTYGTGKVAFIPSQQVWGKTGTSNKGKDDRDLLFVGMTSNLVTGVWVGNDNEAPMKHQTGGSPSIHLWKKFNEGVLNYQKDPEAFQREEEAELSSTKKPLVPSLSTPAKTAETASIEKEEAQEEEGIPEELQGEVETQEVDASENNSERVSALEDPKTKAISVPEKQQLIQDVLESFSE